MSELKLRPPEKQQASRPRLAREYGRKEMSANKEMFAMKRSNEFS